MAVEKHTDVGALIAEAINSYYAWSDYRVWAEQFIGELQSSITEDVIVEAMQGEARRGYKAGWKRAKDNAQKPDGGDMSIPQDQGSDYAQGFEKGLHVGTVGYTAAAHHDKAVAAAQGGNLDAANKHAATAADYLLRGDPSRGVQGLAGHHYHDFVGRAQGREVGEEGVDDDVAADWMMNPQRSQEHGFHRPLMLKHGVEAVKAIDQNLDSPGDDHPHHPADIGSILRARIGAKERHGGEEAGREQEKIKKAAEKRGGADVARKGVQDVELARYKEELARKAYHPEHLAAHIAEHGSHPLEAHETPEDATHAAVHHWKQRMLNDLKTASQWRDWQAAEQKRKEALSQDPDNPELQQSAPRPDLPEDFAHRSALMNLGDMLHKRTYEHPTETVIDEKTGQERPRRFTFDPVQYLDSVIQHSKGSFNRNSKVDALGEQLPGFFHGKRDGQKFWAQKAYGVAQRLERLLQGAHPHYAKGHGMIKASQIHATGKALPSGWGEGYSKAIRARQQQSPEAQQAAQEAMSMCIDVFMEWLEEHVEITNEQVGDISEAIFSKIQANYDRLFEVEYSA